MALNTETGIGAVLKSITDFFSPKFTQLSNSVDGYSTNINNAISAARNASENVQRDNKLLIDKLQGSNTYPNRIWVNFAGTIYSQYGRVCFDCTGTEYVNDLPRIRWEASFANNNKMIVYTADRGEPVSVGYTLYSSTGQAYDVTVDAVESVDLFSSISTSKESIIETIMGAEQQEEVDAVELVEGCPLPFLRISADGVTIYYYVYNDSVEFYILDFGSVGFGTVISGANIGIDTVVKLNGSTPCSMVSPSSDQSFDFVLFDTNNGSVTFPPTSVIEDVDIESDSKYKLKQIKTTTLTVVEEGQSYDCEILIWEQVADEQDNGRNIKEVYEKLGSPKEGADYTTLFGAIEANQGSGSGSGITTEQYNALAKQGSNTNTDLTTLDKKIGSFGSGQNIASLLNYYFPSIQNVLSSNSDSLVYEIGHLGNDTGGTKITVASQLSTLNTNANSIAVKLGAFETDDTVYSMLHDILALQHIRIDDEEYPISEGLNMLNTGMGALTSSVDSQIGDISQALTTITGVS